MATKPLPEGRDMTSPTPQQVLDTLSAGRLVPVVVLDDAAHADPLAAALVAGGLPVAEVTFRTAAAADSIRAMADRGDIVLGAGTVLTELSELLSSKSYGLRYED